MNELLKTVLSLSLSGSLLILVLLLSKQLLRKRMSRRWQYYIWLVVVARLLLPFTPEANLMRALYQGFNGGIEQLEPAPPSSQGSPYLPVAGTSQDGPVQGAQDQLSTGQAESTAPTQDPGHGVLAVVRQNLWLIWLAGALILLVRKFTAYQGFVRYVRAGCGEVSDTALLDQLAQIAEQAGVMRPVELYTNSMVYSPMLIGFFRPCIVIPSAALSDSDFRYTVLHELTHDKRRDMLYKWVVQLAICVHWFNPLVHWMGREVGRACELSCDEAIIKGLDPAGRRAYGDTLLNALGTGGGYRDSLASVTLNESGELMKERLDAIMNYKKLSGAVAGVTLAITLMICCCAAYAGAYSVPTASPDGGSAGEAPLSTLGTAPAAPNANNACLTIDSCSIQYENTSYRWPFVQLRVTNHSDKTIESCEIALLAYDKNGQPLELYWDARNVAENGEVGSIGFNSDGTDYGIVTGIKPYSPKSYRWLTPGCYESIAPGKTGEAGGLHLFDGWWDQPDHIHKVSFFLSCAKQVSFEDGTVWNNPEYERWIADYEGVRIAPGTAGASAAPKTISIPVNIGAIGGGEYVWLGEYALTYGDEIRYEVSAQTGKGMQTGFAALGEDPHNRTYFSISNRELDGILNTNGGFTFLDFVEPGQYKLFIHATEGDLTNVEGMITITSAEADKTEASHAEEYKAWEIQLVDGAYYYQNQRVRIFMDMRANQSFENFSHDEQGSVDIRLTRDEGGSIVRVDYLTQEEADELLGELDGANVYEPLQDISRLAKEDVPGGVLDAINTCAAGKWYVIVGDEYQYIYYDGVPHNYAWRPDLDHGNVSIGIYDIGTSAGRYVLLAAPKDLQLSISYNAKPVTYTTLGLPL